MRLSFAIAWSNHFKSPEGLWYGLSSVRRVPIVLLVIAACGGGGGNITNLPLRWRGVDELPRPSPSVARAFSVTPLTFALRDLRPDTSAVGTYEGSGFVVRTTDNVGQYCTDRMGEILVHAGAHLSPSQGAALEAELLDYQVVESSTFVGTVRLRATLRHGADVVWSKTYTGTSKRWGRTHSPDNFNDALSNSLADATAQLLRDDGFAKSLGG